MLQTLRDKTSSWIAPVILTLLTIPFAFFGMEQYMSQRVETWVARVESPPTWWKDAPHWWPASMLWQRQDINAQDFRQRYDSIRQEQRQQQGEAFDNRAFESIENKRQILDSLIDERVLQMASDRAGIVVGDQQVVREIQSFPAFQVDGKFNAERYQLALATHAVAVRSAGARKPAAVPAARAAWPVGIRHQGRTRSRAQAAQRNPRGQLRAVAAPGA
jgi:peptidyl-prolyl cis-trans isomerase D